MLLGSFQNSIDAKNRCIIPAKLRDELGFKCVMSKGLDGCIILYPLQTWEAQKKQLMELPYSDEAARKYRRFIVANAMEVDIDKQGRILIPQQWKEFAKISKDLVTVGNLDYVEIWAQEVFDSSEAGAKLGPEDFKDFSKSYQI